jgi:hypothetical protein
LRVLPKQFLFYLADQTGEVSAKSWVDVANLLSEPNCKFSERDESTDGDCGNVLGELFGSLEETTLGAPASDSPNFLSDRFDFNNEVVVLFVTSSGQVNLAVSSRT